MICTGNRPRIALDSAKCSNEQLSNPTPNNNTFDDATPASRANGLSFKSPPSTYAHIELNTLLAKTFRYSHTLAQRVSACGPTAAQEHVGCNERTASDKPRTYSASAPMYHVGVCRSNGVMLRLMSVHHALSTGGCCHVSGDDMLLVCVGTIIVPCVPSTRRKA